MGSFYSSDNNSSDNNSNDNNPITTTTTTIILNPYMDQTLFTTNPVPRREGYMFKQTISKSEYNNSYWKERYFVITRGGLFYYQVLSEEVYTIETIQAVDDYGDIAPVKLNSNIYNHGYRWYIIIAKNERKKDTYTGLPSSQTIHLSCKTKADVNHWLNFLQDQLSNKTIHVNTSNISNTNNIMNTTLCQIKIDGTWFERYISYEAGNFYIRDMYKKGFLPLDDARVDINNTLSPESLNNAKFKLWLCDGRILSLDAEDYISMQEWKLGLSLEIENFKKVKKTSSLRDINDYTAIDNIFYHTLLDVLERERLDIAKLRSYKLQQTLKPNKKLFIISLDGGGNKGIIPAIILERLQEIFPDLFDRADLYVGTSNGGMNAMALAFGHTPNTIRAMMELTSKTIFERKSRFSFGQACYSNKYLNMLCTEVWKDLTIGEALKKVIIPTLLLDNNNDNNDNNDDNSNSRSMELIIAHNLDSDNLAAQQVLARDIVMATTAAPTYFPSYQGCVDGGLFAHEPSSLALTLAMSKLGYRTEDIVILSLGTGKVAHYYEDDTSKYNGQTHDWGYQQWLPKFSTVIWDTMVDKSLYITRSLLGSRFHRINPGLPKDIPLDDPHNLPTITEIAYKYNLDDTIQWIRDNVYI